MHIVENILAKTTRIQLGRYLRLQLRQHIGAGRVRERATQKARPTLHSSNRRCGFPASGSPENSRLRHAHVPPDGSAPAAPGARTRSLLAEDGTAAGCAVRSGIFIPAAFSSSYRIVLSVRPLCSTGVTPLLCYYGPLRLPSGPPRRLCIPAGRCSLSLPPCRASQAPRLIFSRALPPHTPESPAGARLLPPRPEGAPQPERPLHDCVRKANGIEVSCRS